MRELVAEMRKTPFVALVLVGIHSTSIADKWSPSMYCSKPTKPYQFTSEWDRSRFVREVEDYKRCIEDYIEEQKAAIKVHSKAAEDAVDEWNRFVNYELR